MVSSKLRTTARGALLALLALTVALAGAARADHHEGGLSPFQSDLLANLEDAEKKLVDLAEAIPADKYGWGPSAEVRTVSKVFMHVAGGNFFFSRNFGVQPPEGIGPGLEEITDKEKVVATLKLSFENAHKAIESVSEADLDSKVSFAGREWTKRSILLLIASHTHEHLGQAIAYARSIGVTPPWSSGPGG